MTKHAREVMHSDCKNAFVHLSSVLGELDLPFHGVYAGTKTFNRVFGRLMSWNHKTNKAETLVVKPAGMTTGMTQNHRDPSFVEPIDAVHGIMRELGTSPGYHETYGALLHGLIGNQAKYFPHFALHGAKKSLSQLKEPPYK